VWCTAGVDSGVFLENPGTYGGTTIYTVSNSQGARKAVFKKVSGFRVRFGVILVTFLRIPGSF